MKHIKLFESFEDIDSICKKYDIENYTINTDGTIDGDGDVNLSGQGFIKLPLKFGRVGGNFYCHNNQLTSLEGCPQIVGGDFYCNDNQLTTLEGAPREVGRHFYCDNKILRSNIFSFNIVFLGITHMPWCFSIPKRISVSLTSTIFGFHSNLSLCTDSIHWINLFCHHSFGCLHFPYSLHFIFESTYIITNND